MSKLYNNIQSKEWMEGYPIGNGRLAAMVWGDEQSDVLALNHEWLWRGIYRNKTTESASMHLDEVRNIFKTEGCGAGTKAAFKYFGSEKTNGRIDAYQPAGNLVFCFAGNNVFQSRELDIENAIAKVDRKDVSAEFYADCIKDVIIASWSSDTYFSGKLSLNRTGDSYAKYSYDVTDKRIYFRCSFIGGISYGVNIEYETDANIELADDGVFVTDASYLRVKINIGTELKNIDKEIKMPAYIYQKDRQAHINRFSSLMNRVRLTLFDSEKNDKLPVSERIKNIRNGETDNGIAVLYFDYGRYLMLSCSICGELPANLQGKWNDDITPPWSSDYHFDINIQMCYWMCEAADMSECVKSLVDFLMRYLESGSRTAQKHYGCKGIVLPLSDDAWAEGTPVSGIYGIWIGGAAWMAQHVWWHYTYSGDKAYLEKTAYPYFKAVAEFYEDYLVKDDEGILQIIPSQSPENRFAGADMYDVSLCVSSAMDVQLAFDALGYAIDTANILGIDSEKVKLWENMRSSLPEFKIGNDGRLLEWNEEKTEVEPGHRHLSHLYGMYPSDIFMQEGREKQYIAAKKSLDFRLSHGGGHTGWSRAWLSCLYARLGNSKGFLEHLNGLAVDFATDSLLDLHPPRIFQIDGNFGAVAAIIESVVSVYDNKVHLLRAVPDEWQSGSLCGIKVPGGHKIDVHWQSGKATKIKIVFGFEKNLTVVVDNLEKTYTGFEGEILDIVLQ